SRGSEEKFPSSSQHEESLSQPILEENRESVQAQQRSPSRGSKEKFPSSSQHEDLSQTFLDETVQSKQRSPAAEAEEWIPPTYTQYPKSAKPQHRANRPLQAAENESKASAQLTPAIFYPPVSSAVLQMRKVDDIIAAFGEGGFFKVRHGDHVVLQ